VTGPGGDVGEARASGIVHRVAQPK
jgi:hypothetical protein